MGQFAGTPFGIGTPTISPIAQYLGTSNPFSAGGAGIGPYAVGAVPSLQVPQIAQLLQTVPQQLYQVQLLQQQLLLHVQQLIQWVPAQLQQLQQLQQLIQVATHQIQQLQQQGQPISPGASGSLPFTLVPQAFGGQAAGPVM